MRTKNPIVRHGGNHCPFAPLSWRVVPQHGVAHPLDATLGSRNHRIGTLADFQQRIRLAAAVSVGQLARGCVSLDRGSPSIRATIAWPASCAAVAKRSASDCTGQIPSPSPALCHPDSRKAGAMRGVTPVSSARRRRASVGAASANLRSRQHHSANFGGQRLAQPGGRTMAKHTQDQHGSATHRGRLQATTSRNSTAMSVAQLACPWCGAESDGVHSPSPDGDVVFRSGD
jgi:hypothetical protein